MFRETTGCGLGIYTVEDTCVENVARLASVPSIPHVY
jgi:hypothetical protein